MAKDPEFSGWENAKAAFAFVFERLGLAARIAGPWLAIVVAVAYAGNHWVMQLISDPAVYSLQQAAFFRLAVGLLVLVVFGLGYGVVAVAWHRVVLQRDAGSALLPGGTALLYLLAIAGIYGVAWFVPFGTATAAIAALPNETPTRGVGTIFLLALAAALVLIGFSLRFSLKLPAIALGDREMTFRRSWSETAALWPGLLWGTVVISVPLIVATRALGFLTRFGLNEIFLFVDYLVYYALIFGSILIYATFLSLAYRRTTGDIATTFE